MNKGAFALAGVAVFYDEEDGCATNAHIGVIGAGARPQRIGAAEAAVNGRAVDAQAILSASRAAAAAVDPAGDLDASAAYRRSLVGTLVERALKLASSRAETQSE